MILAFDTASNVCSVVLSDKGNLISLRETSVKNDHAARLSQFIHEVISSAGISFSSLDAIAVSAGPGSYTGLRIGVATAKGLCFAINKPLIAIPTLKAMAMGMTISIPSSLGQEAPVFWYCPMLDARRMEVYCGIYDARGNEIRTVMAEIMDPSSFQEEMKDHRIVFGGDGAKKCKPFLGQNKNSIFLDNFTISAKYLIPWAEKKLDQGDFENLGCFEPFYLKEFVAGRPRVKGLY